jgi:aspartyl aminopeptidase
MIAEQLDVKKEDVLAKDLFLVNRQKGIVWGYEKEFVSSAKLDDLQCAFVSLKGFLNAKNEHAVNVYCLFDNEEVGSNTKQGAMSTFLQDTLKRINLGLHKSEEEYYAAVASSFLVSCDNAHAVHPNHPEKNRYYKLHIFKSGNCH